MRLRLLLLLLGLCCIQGCAVRRSLLTPTPTLPTPSSSSSRIDVTAGGRVATHIARRQDASTSGPTLVTPYGTVDASGTFRFGDGVFALRPSFTFGLPTEATSGLGDTSRGGPPTFGFAPGLQLRADVLDRRLLLDFEADPFFGWTAERVEYCTLDYRDCRVQDEELHPAFYPRGSVTISYAFTPWLRAHVLGGAATQPVDYGMVDFELVGIVGAGLAVEPIDLLAIVVDVQWPFAGGPFEYGPTIGVALRLQPMAGTPTELVSPPEG